MQTDFMHVVLKSAGIKHFVGIFGAGVAEWFRCSVSNLVGFTRVGSNPIVGIRNL